MLGAEATGVATYARALRAAQQSLSLRASLLGGGSASTPGSPASRGEQWRRRLRAAVPAGAWAHRTPEGYERYDLFRLAQAYFTLHGRLLPVRLPGATGIMHWSYPVPLRVVGWRNLYTVHDTIPLTHPELTPIAPTRHRRLLRLIAKQADAIVTVSYAAQRDIMAALALPPGQVVNCSQPVVVDDPDASDLPAGLVPGRYLLVCGMVEPRKNITRIVEAYRTSGAAMPLVIAGPDGWQSESTAALLAETQGVIRLTWQPRGTIVTLLAQARALIMPSLAEGFGLPVAEAMALGTPVLTSATGALAETAGHAALLVDPHDTAAIGTAIACLACNDSLCDDLSRAGRSQALHFGAERFARRLDALYARVAGTDYSR